MGNITASYRWFAAVYIICCFFVLPLLIFSLSLAGWQVLVGVGVPLIVMLIIIVVINVLQKRKPGFLPKGLQSWDFLPLWAHSLDPWDKMVGACTAKCCCCCKCCQVSNEDQGHGVEECVEQCSVKHKEAYDNPVMAVEKEIENELRIEMNNLKPTQLWEKDCMINRGILIIAHKLTEIKIFIWWIQVKKFYNMRKKNDKHCEVLMVMVNWRSWLIRNTFVLLLTDSMKRPIVCDFWATDLPFKCIFF